MIILEEEFYSIGISATNLSYLVWESQTSSSNKSNNQFLLPTKDINNFEFKAQKMSPLPRSIGRTINRIKLELKPQAEAEVINDFHSSSTKTKTAITFILSLIVVPILVQHLSKQFIVSRIVYQLRGEHNTDVFLNKEMKEEAFRELKAFEEELKFASLVDNSPKLSSEVIEDKFKHKATEVLEEFREKSTSAISNVFADSEHCCSGDYVTGFC
ncbi:hypothetical protein H6G76_36390 [Nostoc sp. FACHB-152]|uniref:hypothetical protein n=1 Tax=unclassified Nostoc TaxID=2593658 RepID=UPI001684B2B9|nr:MULTISPECIES: hypothetical protein [unclassified Nostoc]MBD2452480.1 hypothetical protein [Nostoc sp. FACHB-152]MBD2473406.1 hypothetical protein [Nostoc sp. FACHB-145]